VTPDLTMLPQVMLLASAVADSLVDWLKPILLLATVLPWAWLVSSRLEPDARYFHLNYHGWNLAYLAALMVAVVAVLLIPIFWIGWPVAMIVLLTPVLLYWKLRNAAVPEERRFYLGGGSFAASMARRKAAASQRDAALVFIGPDKKPRQVPNREEPLHAIHLVAEQVIEPAMAGRAARVELAPAQGGYAVSQFIDGVRYRRDPISIDAGNAAIDYLKSCAGLDVSDRRRRQAATFGVRSPSGEATIDITVSGSSAGQTAKIEFDRKTRISRPFDGLGLLPPQLEPFAQLFEPHDRHGVVLVGAPPGHGLTTTGYAMLQRHDAFTSNIKTLERDVQLELDGVDHTEFDAANSATDFATMLQSIMRRDPDIVLIGDIRTDPRTAAVAAAPGMKGPLVYVLQSQPSIATQYAEWARAVGDLKKAASAMRVIVNQRLFRMVCPNCRQAYQPTAEQAKRLGLPGAGPHTLYRHSGKIQVKNRIESCPVCQGLGYFGMVSAFEVMAIDDESRKHLVAGDFKAAYAVARRNRMLYLQEAALAKVRAGHTTVEEVARVLSPSSGQQGSAGPTPGGPTPGGPPASGPSAGGTASAAAGAAGG